MHAADYPGSHVVVKNPEPAGDTRQKLLSKQRKSPPFTATPAQQPKVAVHYTQKKFVNKPKGAKPGFVSLSSFKTILVEPRIEDR